MYEQVFNFNARPFTSTPYVKHYFGASAMSQAFGQAAICIQRGSGPVIAIGDIGTGKSLLLAKLAAEHQSVFQIVNIDCSRIHSRKDLLQNILFQLDKPFNMEGETELGFAVIESAKPTEASPNGLLLLVDDAETLTTEIFEELRVLTNIVVDGSPQVRIVLAGRRSLEERLADPALASFSQRIASRVFLDNLSRDETAAYVIEHINRVGGDGQGMFPTGTTTELHQLTDGCPRLINQVCDFVLILASTRGIKTVSPNLIEEAWNDVQSLPMGGGSIAAVHSTPSLATDQSNDWTLIEFGQLDDDSPEPAGANVYDFENSAPETETNFDYSPQEELTELATEATTETAAVSEPETAPAPNVDIAAAALASTTGVDPELGIDLGSLQAMQAAAAAHRTSEVESTPTTETPETTTVETAAETEADNAARVAMEQQLGAVFGTPLPSLPTPEPAVNEVAEPANETTTYVESAESPTHQPVDLNPAEAEPPTETNSIVGITSASAITAGLVAGVSKLDIPDTPLQAETFQPATPALPVPETPQTPEPDANQILESLTAEPPNVPVAPETPASLASGFSVEQFTPATDPVEVTEQSPTADQPAPSTPLATSPIEESVTVDTTATDQIASATIEQNHKALELSSADFSQLTPLHNPSPEPVIRQSELTDDAEVAKTTNLPAGVSWLDSSIAAQEKAAAEAAAKAAAEAAAAEVDTATEVETALASPTLETYEPATNAPEATDATNTAKRGFSILPTATGQPTEPAAIEPVEVEPTTSDFVSQSDAPVETQPTSEIPNAPAASTDLRIAHNDESVSDEISRKADEILARLQNKLNPAPAVEQDEQILSAIQQQQREVSDSQLPNVPSEQSIAMPAPTVHQDDSEMLVVNQPPSSAKAKPQPETFPMTDSPISSGRASRMDYEQLFDRLRNHPEENQQ